MRYGITEAGDAGLDYTWGNKLFPECNIIISKHLTKKNEKLISLLVNNKDKIIFHCTCTGYGGSVIEPNVPTFEEVREGVLELIARGFPAEQVVLRTDPVIPTPKGISTVKKVWDSFKNTPVKRVRYSILDMYPHVKERFLATVGYLPYATFRAPDLMIDALNSEISKYSDRYEFEVCTEGGCVGENLGCISSKDLRILNKPVIDEIGGFQRKGCKCLKGKTELLSNKKQCPSGCIYCYWR